PAVGAKVWPGLESAEAPAEESRLRTVRPGLPQTPAPATPGNTAPDAISGIAPPAPEPDVQIMPIDLPTALRLANASNPTIAVAREAVQAAYARLQQARVVWLPNLEGGPAYLHHDGRIQN